MKPRDGEQTWGMPAELSVFPERPKSSSFWAARWTTGLKTKWTNLGLLLEIRHEGELKRLRCISATNRIMVKFAVQSTELCLLGKHNPVPFPAKESESYWVAQEMLVGALVQTEKPGFGWVAFKILALIHCCAHCRTSNSVGKWDSGILSYSVFWGLLGSHFGHNTG